MASKPLSHAARLSSQPALSTQQLSFAFDAEPSPGMLATPPAPVAPPSRRQPRTDHGTGDQRALGAETAGTQIDSIADAGPTPPSDRPGSLRRRRVTVGGHPLDYRLRRARRRSIGFLIDDGGLTVSAPRWVSLAEIDAAVVEKQRWIHAKLAEWRTWRAKRPMHNVAFVDGGRLPYLGGQLTIRLRGESGHSRRVEIVGAAELHLALPHDAADAQIKDAVAAWLQEEARRVLGERLALLSERIEIKPSSWALSSARSQWGSCTSSGRIRLNWRLVHFALPVIDYVVAHELAHLKELNHSPRFWHAVGLVLPGFEAARDQIRDEDLSCLPL